MQWSILLGLRLLVRVLRIPWDISTTICSDRLIYTKSWQNITVRRYVSNTSSSQTRNSSSTKHRYKLKRTYRSLWLWLTYPYSRHCWHESWSCLQLVFSSSATVYGQPDKVPCVEDFELKAMNPYGRTKVCYDLFNMWLWSFLKLVVNGEWCICLSFFSSFLKKLLEICRGQTKNGE